MFNVSQRFEVFYFTDNFRSFTVSFFATLVHFSHNFVTKAEKLILMTNFWYVHHWGFKFTLSCVAGNSNIFLISFCNWYYFLMLLKQLHWIIWAPYGDQWPKNWPSPLHSQDNALILKMNWAFLNSFNDFKFLAAIEDSFALPAWPRGGDCIQAILFIWLHFHS